ncbi:hypothetical protein KHQ81_10230 [Mycoplasmatota bacterium]|nr:hypothetical protein KHQ81_10230 [Mycoplasmatota bacterium]
MNENYNVGVSKVKYTPIFFLVTLLTVFMILNIDNLLNEDESVILIFSLGILVLIQPILTVFFYKYILKSEPILVITNVEIIINGIFNKKVRYLLKDIESVYINKMFHNKMVYISYIKDGKNKRGTLPGMLNVKPKDLVEEIKRRREVYLSDTTLHNEFSNYDEIVKSNLRKDKDVYFRVMVYLFLVFWVIDCIVSIIKDPSDVLISLGYLIFNSISIALVTELVIRKVKIKPFLKGIILTLSILITWFVALIIYSVFLYFNQ